MGAAQRRRANRSAKEFIAWAERQRATGACGMFYWPRIQWSPHPRWPEGVLLTREERQARDRGVAYDGKPTFYQRNPPTMKGLDRG